MTNLSTPVQAVLALFQGALADVRFADIDAGALTRLAAEVEATAVELQNEEFKVSALRQALSERQEVLIAHAQRALAYARVYAESDPELSERLNAIVLVRPVKKGRPPTSIARGSERPLEPEAQQPSGPETSGERALIPERAPEPQRALFQRKGRRRDATSPSDDAGHTEAPVVGA